MAISRKPATPELTQSDRKMLIELAARYKSLGNRASAERCLEKANFLGLKNNG